MRYSDFEKVMNAHFKIEYTNDADINYIKNREYLLDSIMLVVDNNQPIYSAMVESKKRKVHSVLWEGVQKLCTECVQTTDELDDSLEYWKLSPLPYQIKRYLSENFEGLGTLEPLIKEYERQRAYYPNC